MTSGRIDDLLRRHDQDGMIRHGLMVILLQNAGAVVNVIFHMVMGRALAEAEYGVLTAMLASVLILGTPMIAVQNTLAHFTARLIHDGQGGRVRNLVRQWFRTLSVPAILIVVAGLLARNHLVSFFHLAGPLPVVLTAFTLGGTLLLYILPGVFQGMQRFVWMCMTINIWGLARTVLGAMLVYTVTRTAIAGLAAQMAGVAASIALGFVGLRMLTRGIPREEGSISSLGQYFGKSFAALMFFAVLMNADMLMVKHFFSAQDAGYFAQAGTIGRTVVFICQPIAMALFPKVVTGGGVGRGHRRTLWRAIVLSLLLVGSAALVCALFPALPLRILFGVRDPLPTQMRLVPAVIWAMSPLGIAYVLMNFEMAQHRFACAVPLSIGAAAYVGGVCLWHGHLAQVAAVLGVSGSLCTLALIALLPWRAAPAHGG